MIGLLFISRMINQFIPIPVFFVHLLSREELINLKTDNEHRTRYLLKTVFHKFTLQILCNLAQEGPRK